VTRGAVKAPRKFIKYKECTLTIAMNPEAHRKLEESIEEAREIRFECLKLYPDINLIHERAHRLYFKLCQIFDYGKGSLSGTPHRKNAMHARFESLSSPERDELLERARQTLPSKSHNDGDGVLVAALELLATGWKRTPK